MAKPPPRLYIEEGLAQGQALSLSKEQAHYLGTVLRLGEGDSVLLFNGRDGEWRASLADITRKGGVAVLNQQTRAPQNSPDVTLWFAPLKKGPTDFIIQKATELGVGTIQPIITARTNSDRFNVDRARIIATEAAEQSERLDVPTIDEHLSLEKALADRNGHLIFCDEAGDDAEARWGGAEGRGKPPLEGLSAMPDGPAIVLIGPEGGFTPEERENLRNLDNSTAISLGPLILKAETAAITALALWQAIKGHARC